MDSLHSSFKTIADLAKQMKSMQALGTEGLTAQVKAAVLPDALSGVAASLKTAESPAIRELANRMKEQTSAIVASSQLFESTRLPREITEKFAKFSVVHKGLIGDVAPLMKRMNGFAVPTEAVDAFAKVLESIARVRLELRQDLEEAGLTEEELRNDGRPMQTSGDHSDAAVPLTRGEWIAYVTYQKETLELIKSMLRPKKVTIAALLIVLIWKFGDILDLISNSLSMVERFSQHERPLTKEDLEKFKAEVIDTIRSLQSVDTAQSRHAKVYLPKLYHERRYTRLKTKVRLKPKKGSMVLLWISAGREVTLREIKGVWAEISFEDSVDRVTIHGWVMKKHLSERALSD